MSLPGREQSRSPAPKTQAGSDRTASLRACRNLNRDNEVLAILLLDERWPCEVGRGIAGGSRAKSHSGLAVAWGNSGPCDSFSKATLVRRPAIAHGWDREAHARSEPELDALLPSILDKAFKGELE